MFKVLKVIAEYEYVGCEIQHTNLTLTKGVSLENIINHIISHDLTSSWLRYST